MINVNLKTEFAKDVLIDILLSNVDPDSILSYFYPSVAFHDKYEWNMIESELGVQENWDEYDGDRKDAWAVIKFAEKNTANPKTCYIKFHGYHRSHDGTYLEGIKEVQKVVKTIETYE